jgi:hypothetical protein
MKYIRAWHPGCTYFFTVNLAERSYYPKAMLILVIHPNVGHRYAQPNLPGLKLITRDAMTDRYVEVVRIALKVCMSAFVSAIIAGCPSVPSVKDWADKAIGSPINNLFEAARRPGSYIFRNDKQIQKYQLENKNFIYIEPVGDNCNVHWEVNSSGIIVGYRLEGSRCW